MFPRQAMTRVLLSAILLAVGRPLNAAESTGTARAAALVQSLQTHFAQGQVKKIVQLYHPQNENRMDIGKSLQAAKDLDAFPKRTLTLLEVTEQANAR